MNEPQTTIHPEAALPRDQALLTVPEAAHFLRVSRNLAYELIAQHRIPHLRLGRRILIPRYSLQTWILEESVRPRPA